MTYQMKTSKIINLLFYKYFLGPFSAPKNIRAIALDTLIIVKWTANRNTEFQEIYFVEYRTYLDTAWRTFPVEGSTALINGLAPHTIYFVRVYSKIAAGKSYKTEEIMVKTGSVLVKINNEEAKLKNLMVLHAMTSALKQVLTLFN